METSAAMRNKEEAGDCSASSGERTPEENSWESLAVAASGFALSRRSEGQDVTYSAASATSVITSRAGSSDGNQSWPSNRRDRVGINSCPSESSFQQQNVSVKSERTDEECDAMREQTRNCFQNEQSNQRTSVACTGEKESHQRGNSNNRTNKLINNLSKPGNNANSTVAKGDSDGENSSLPRPNKTSRSNDEDSEIECGDTEYMEYKRSIKYEKLVPRSEYTETSSVVYNQIEESVIRMNSPDKFDRLLMIHGILATTGLFTLIQGYRVEPKIDPIKNKFGYSERHLLDPGTVELPPLFSDSYPMSTGYRAEKIVPMESDDIFHYHRDLVRLYILVTKMFHPETHFYVSIRTQSSHNGVDAYFEICDYVFGRRFNDRVAAECAIEKFRMNRSKTFRFEYHRWERLFTNLSHINSTPVSDAMKNEFLHKQLRSDPRAPIISVYISCHVNNFTYARSIERLLDIIGDLPGHLTTVQR